MGVSGERNVRDGLGGFDIDLTGLPAGPVIVPQTVGVIPVRFRGEGKEHPACMVIVFDLETVPGLPETVDRHQRGEELNIKTRWIALLPKDPSGPATVLLSLQLLDRDLVLYVAIDLDRHKPGLMIAAQTKHVVIAESSLESDLRLQDPRKAFQNGKSMIFEVEDARPLLQSFLQRFDIQPKTLASEISMGGAGKEGESVAEFLDGTTPVELSTLRTVPGKPMIVVLVDPAVGSLRERLGSKPYFEGLWSVRRSEDGPIARLDCNLEGERIASWVLHAPSQEFARLVASGSHGISIVSRHVREGDDEGVMSQVRRGVPIWASGAPLAMLEIIE